MKYPTNRLKFKTIFELFKETGRYQRYADNTKKNHLVNWLPFSNRFGEKMYNNTGVAEVADFFQSFTHKAPCSNKHLKELKFVCDHLVDTGKLVDSKYKNIPRLPYRVPVQETWSDCDISEFRNAYPVGSTARLGFELLFFTGARPSDVQRLGHDFLKEGKFRIIAQKNYEPLFLPLIKPLQECMAHVPKEQKTLLVSPRLQLPFYNSGFSQYFSNCAKKIGINKTAKGLRIRRAEMMIEQGCPEGFIVAWFGWSSSAMVYHYGKNFKREEAATGAIKYLKDTSKK